MAKRAKRKIQADLNRTNRLETVQLTRSIELKGDLKTLSDIKDLTDSDIDRESYRTKKDMGWQPIDSFHHATNEELLKIEKEYLNGKFS